MNKSIFTRDDANATLTVERVFPAVRSRVWQALTDAALLDRWWGPSPWYTETVAMDFRVGGYWFYAMKGPEGEAHYCRMDYLEIEPETRLKTSDYFTDADGNRNDALPVQVMDMRLIDEGRHTRFVTVIEYASIEDLDTILEMGMREGYTQAQDQLETLLLEG